MKWLVHGFATLVVLLVATFCVLVQVAHVDDAISQIGSRPDASTTAR